MAQIIDITGKITNELPTLKITDNIIVTVNNRKSVVLNIQAMVQETERKGEEYDQVKFMDKALGMIIGEKNTEAINELDLPMTEYKEIYSTVMGMATGTYWEENTPNK